MGALYRLQWFPSCFCQRNVFLSQRIWEWKKFFFSDLDDPVEVLCSAIDKNSRLGVDKLFPAKFFVPMIHRLGLKDFEVSSLCVDEVRAVKMQKRLNGCGSLLA